VGAAVLRATRRADLPGGWLRTTSLEEAERLCGTAFYPHRLTLLGPPTDFALTQRLTTVGPITMRDMTYDSDVRLHLGETRAGYLVHLPAVGGPESLYRGKELTATTEWGSVYRPNDDACITTRWPGGSRHLAVRIDQAAVDTALENLIDQPVNSPIPFASNLPLDSRATESWVQLVMAVQQQCDSPDSLLRHALVQEPLVESMIRGLLLLLDHPYREALTAPAPAVRPAAVRDAMDVVEADPGAPLTVGQLAKHCHVSVRTLQEGFQRHLGMSPTAYLREVRLRRAHGELRSADPSRSTVASIAHRWGFTHLGRFAAVHKARYGESPTHTLHAAH
jgi:AraC-like DNA-binding protein